MARVCMLASGAGSLIFIDDVTADGSSWRNLYVYNPIELEPDNDLEHAAYTTKGFIGGRKWKAKSVKRRKL